MNISCSDSRLKPELLATPPIRLAVTVRHLSMHRHKCNTKQGLLPHISAIHHHPQREGRLNN